MFFQIVLNNVVRTIKFIETRFAFESGSWQSWFVVFRQIDQFSWNYRFAFLNDRNFTIFVSSFWFLFTIFVLSFWFLFLNGFRFFSCSPFFRFQNSLSWRRIC